MKTLLLTMALVLACGEKDVEDTSEATDGGAVSDGGGAADGGTASDGGEEKVECSTLSVDECAEEDACFSPVGWPILATDVGWCVDYSGSPQPQGCIEAQDCGAVVVYATTEDRPDECLWLFSAVCLPDGWIRCPEDKLPACE